MTDSIARVDAEIQPSGAHRAMAWVRTRLGAIVVSAILLLVLVRIYQVTPGYDHGAYQRFTILSEIELLSQQSVLDRLTINDTGMECGAYKTFGLPASMTMSLLVRPGGLSPDAAYLVFDGAVLLIAFWGGYSLLRRDVGLGRALSALGAFLFLANFLVYGQRGFDAQIYGFMLLPAYIRSVLWYAHCTRQDSFSARWALRTIAFVGIASINLFMIGYAFSMTLLFAGCLWSCLALSCRERKHWRPLVGLSLGLAASVLIPGALYKLYIPTGEAMHPMPLDYFRGQGVDLVSLITPGTDLAYSSLLKIGKVWDGYRYFGDGSNVRYNYVGIILLLLAAAYPFTLRKQNGTGTHVLAVAGLLAFILALGPSLKINDTRPAPATKSSIVNFADYLQPANEATLNLHTDLVYTKIPLVQNMRAVHRWLLVTKLALIALALAAIQMTSKRSRWVAAALCLLVFAEMLPAQALRLDKPRNSRAQVAKFDSDVIRPLKSHVTPGTRVLFLSNENDFLANYLALQLNVRTYNVAGDKPGVLSRMTWPPAITRICAQQSVNDEAFFAMKAGLIDSLVVPRFSLRWNSYAWPPAQRALQERDEKLRQSLQLDDPRFLVARTQYATVLRLAPSAAQDQQAPRVPAYSPFSVDQRLSATAPKLNLATDSPGLMRGVHEYEAQNRGRWIAPDSGYLLRRRGEQQLFLEFWNPDLAEYSIHPLFATLEVNGVPLRREEIKSSGLKTWSILLPEHVPANETIEVSLRFSGKRTAGSADRRDLAAILRRLELRRSDH